MDCANQIRVDFAMLLLLLKELSIGGFATTPKFLYQFDFGDWPQACCEKVNLLLTWSMYLKEKHMKLKSIIAVGMVSLTLASCGTTNQGEVKKKLEEGGYTVTVKTGEEYEQSPLIEELDGGAFLESFIAAENDSEANYLYAWYFFSIDDASTWKDFHEAWFSDIKTPKSASLTSGQNNNIIWAGTNAAAKVVGWTLF